MQLKTFPTMELIIPNETIYKILELGIPEVQEAWCDHVFPFCSDSDCAPQVLFTEGKALCFGNKFFQSYFVLTPAKLAEGVSICAQLGLLTICGKTVTEDCIHKTVARSILEHALFRGGNYQ